MPLSFAIKAWFPAMGEWRFEENPTPTGYIWPEAGQVEFPEATQISTEPIKLPNVTYNPIHDTYDVIDHVEEKDGFNVGQAIAGAILVCAFTRFLRTYLLSKPNFNFEIVMSKLFSTAKKPTQDHRRIRKAFQETEYFTRKPYDNHSHGVSAAARADANTWMDAVCVATGLNRFSFQMSSSEQDTGMKGTRYFMWAKDMQMDAQFDIPDDGDLVTLTDVDYYVDMPTLLAAWPRPYLLYTLVPERTGAIRQDYEYHFNESGEITMNVSGGASYTHRLWDYNHDTVIASHRNSVGVVTSSVLYDVQTKKVGQDRCVILLTPIRHFYGITAWLASTGTPLQRVEHLTGEFAKLSRTIDNVKYVSISRIGQTSAAVCKSDVFDALVSTKRIAPQEKIVNFQVKQLMEKHPVDGVDIALASPIFTDYFNSVSDFNVRPWNLTARPAMVAMNYNRSLDPGYKTVVVPFAEPLVAPAFAPVKDAAASQRSIQGRVLDCQKASKDLESEGRPTAFRQRCAGEFVKLLIPEPHILTPYDYEQVALKQTKPGQKKDLRDADFVTSCKKKVKTFMKAEPYGKITDPRNITTFLPGTKLEYAHFMYALMDFLKTIPCYAFGKTPKEVAERVAGICSEAEWSVLCPDISRMDGHVNKFCRELEAAIGSRAFAQEWVESFLSSHEKSYGNSGTTTFGQRYEQEESRGSGEMGTSAWNTLINMFIMYYAFRRRGNDPEHAWTLLLTEALCGGDDGLVADLYPKQMEAAAREVGFIVKSPEFLKSATGVNFLARVYGPGVWAGDPTSMCSLKRQLEKFHLTVEMPLKPEQKLFEKSLSFKLTDSNTPIIGPFVNKVLEEFGDLITTNTIVRWGDQHSVDVQYPNVYAAWMDEIAATELPDFNHAAFGAWLKTAKRDQLLNVPKFYVVDTEERCDEYDVEPGIVHVFAPTLVEKVAARSSSVEFMSDDS